MGCCLGVLLLGGAPRVALVLWLFLDPTRVAGTFSRWNVAFGSWEVPLWAWTFIGLVLLPWTTVAYVFVAPGGVSSVEWLAVFVGLLLDIGAHGGSRRAVQSRKS